MYIYIKISQIAPHDVRVTYPIVYLHIIWTILPPRCPAWKSKVVGDGNHRHLWHLEASGTMAQLMGFNGLLNGHATPYNRVWCEIHQIKYKYYKYISIYIYQLYMIVYGWSQLPLSGNGHSSRINKFFRATFANSMCISFAAPMLNNNSSYETSFTTCH